MISAIAAIQIKPLSLKLARNVPVKMHAVDAQCRIHAFHRNSPHIKNSVMFLHFNELKIVL